MYLARLWLDPFAEQARRDLADPYQMHRTLVRAFVTNDFQAPPRFLWRLEPMSPWRDPQLIVQSAQSGRWRYLEDLGNYLKRPVESKEVDLDRLLQEGARYRFRIAANPTVTRNRKRYGLVGEEAQLAWLDRQGARHGFQVESALVIGADVLGSRKDSQLVRLRRVYYEGILTAMDLPALSNTLLAGIGPGKAFGLGLLSIVPVGRTDPAA